MLIKHHQVILNQTLNHHLLYVVNDVLIILEHLVHQIADQQSFIYTRPIVVKEATISFYKRTEDSNFRTIYAIFLIRFSSCAF